MVNADSILLLSFSFLLLAAAFVIVLMVINVVYGEFYTFNMTQDLQEEQRLLMLCIYTDIKIPNCHDMYGGIDTTYGEPMK